MGNSEKGSFRPPGDVVWKCPACLCINRIKETQCKKCGATKPEQQK